VLIGPARPTATLRLATQLLFADEGKRGAELFVLDDRGLRDLTNFVEGPIRQVDAAVTDYQPTIGIVDHGTRLPIAALARSLGSRMNITLSYCSVSARERVRIDMRILSVISWYHLAFFSISMAMLGMTAGYLVVYFKEQWFPSDELLENLVWICSAFAIAVAISTLSLISSVLMVGGKPEFLMTVLLWLKLIIILALTYSFARIAISLFLTRSPWPISVVYGVDLIGAAVGCLVLLGILTFVDSVSALFVVGAVGAFAAASFLRAGRVLGYPGNRLLRVARLRMFAWPWTLTAAFALLAFGNAAIQPYGLKLSIVKNRP
jgi:hypothetical protein